MLNFVICAPIASINPPRRIHITGLDQVPTYFSQLGVISIGVRLPRKKTASPIIRKLTANGGIASVIHRSEAMNSIISAFFKTAGYCAEGRRKFTSSELLKTIITSSVMFLVNGHLIRLNFRLADNRESSVEGGSSSPFSFVIFCIIL